MPEVTSALPSAARAKLEQLQNSGNPPPADTPPADTPPADTPPADTPPADTPPADTPPNPGTVERVTLSREELNELRAAAGQTTAMQARLEESEARNEALALRLTELESSHKGNPNPSPAPAPAAAPSALTEGLTEQQFTAEEEEQFGDSREYVEKVAINACIKLLTPILGKIQTDVTQLHDSTKRTTKTIEQQQQEAFANQMRSAVPNLSQIIKHQHWGKFLDEVDDLSGASMEKLLGTHIANRNAVGAAKIYNRFADKYIKPIPSDGNTAAEYAGALPNSAAVTPPADPNNPKAKLKLSDRTKASKDYINKKITFDELQQVNKRFEEAEKAGNIDYNA